MVFLPEVSMRRVSKTIIIDSIPVKIQTDSNKTNSEEDSSRINHMRDIIDVQ